MYVNGYILAVPEDKKAEYTAAAKIFADVAKDYGVVEIFENWEVDVPDGEHTDYRRAVKAEPGEMIVFSWVVWPDRETGDKAHKGMWEDPRMKQVAELPIDGKRMIMGGFEPVLSYHKP